MKKALTQENCWKDSPSGCAIVVGTVYCRTSSVAKKSPFQLHSIDCTTHGSHFVFQEITSWMPILWKALVTRSEVNWDSGRQVSDERVTVLVFRARTTWEQSYLLLSPIHMILYPLINLYNAEEHATTPVIWLSLASSE